VSNISSILDLLFRINERGCIIQCCTQPNRARSHKKMENPQKRIILVHGANLITAVS